MSLYADMDAVFNSFENFGLALIPILLLLSFLNYLTRFFKWHYYLFILGVKISYKDSLLIFMSGLIMSVTPGKFGEVMKSFMVKQITDEPISKTAPVMLVERITDFLSLLFIALIGSYVFGIGEGVVVGTSIFFIFLIIFLSNTKYAYFFFNILSRFKAVNKIIPKIKEAYQSSYIMLKPKPLFLMFLLSLFSWFFECFGFYLILTKFNVQITVLWASFVYAFSTILGSITMLPGGLGVTDGSLTFLLIDNSIDKDIAVASTFIIRIVTLWFAVFVGIVSVLIYQKKYGNIED